jgi:hypothetical protein
VVDVRPGCERCVDRPSFYLFMQLCFDFGLNFPCSLYSAASPRGRPHTQLFALLFMHRSPMIPFSYPRTFLSSASNQTSISLMIYTPLIAHCLVQHRDNFFLSFLCAPACLFTVFCFSRVSFVLVFPLSILVFVDLLWTPRVR